jgi:uncharacterized protein YjbI with pentapeptide repeats
MTFHTKRAEERRNIAKGLERGRHKTYHPKTNNLEKRSYKPQFNIEVSVACKDCKQVLSRRIDNLKHFKELLEKNFWKDSNIFIKSDNTVNREADLHKADLEKANLRGTNLYMADLREVNLHDADLITEANQKEMTKAYVCPKCFMKNQLI